MGEPKAKVIYHHATPTHRPHKLPRKSTTTGMNIRRHNKNNNSLTRYSRRTTLPPVVVVVLPAPNPRTSPLNNIMRTLYHRQRVNGCGKLGGMLRTRVRSCAGNTVVIMMMMSKDVAGSFDLEGKYG